MPGPDPHAISIEPVIGGSELTYYRYFGTGKEGNRKRRIAKIGERLAANDWVCRWCSDPMPIWKRVDSIYCRESCRKRATRFRKQHSCTCIS